MKWIKYNVLQNTVNTGTAEAPVYEDILLEKRIGYNEDNLAIAQQEAYNGEYTIEEDDEVIENEPLSIENGGTGAKTAQDALRNLGITLCASDTTLKSLGSLPRTIRYSDGYVKAGSFTPTYDGALRLKATVDRAINADYFVARITTSGNEVVSQLYEGIQDFEVSIDFNVSSGLTYDVEFYEDASGIYGTTVTGVVICGSTIIGTPFEDVIE